MRNARNRGHTMGVAAEILDDVLRSAEGRLGIDDPFALPQRGQIIGEGLRIAQRLDLAEKLEFALSVGFL